MGGDDKRAKRSVRDLSHLLISTEEKAANKFWVLACVDTVSECARSGLEEIVSSLQPRTQRVTLFDFHQSELKRDFEGAGEGRAWLLEFPWFLTEVGRAMAPRLDFMIFILEPAMSSLKTAYRILKALNSAVSGEILFKWNGQAVNPRVEIALSELIHRFLEKKIVWIENAGQIGDRMAAKVRNREGTGADDFEDEILSAVRREPAVFYGRGELSAAEMEAFSALSRHLISRKSGPADPVYARI